MTDDWSLKGKEKTPEKDIFQSMQNLNKRFIYSKEDIETLRQKLIEDLVNIIDEYPSVKKAINKRFGKEE